MSVRTLAYAGMILALGLGRPVVGAGDQDACRFIWEEANSRMAVAASPEDFRESARIYDRLLRMGVQNGPLYANMGTALLAAGLADEALECYRRAEVFDGSTPELSNAMRLALRTISRDHTADLPWYRFLLMWHYGLPIQDRWLAASLASLVFWLSLCLRRAGLSSIGALRVAAVIVFVLCVSSAFTSWYQVRIPLSIAWDRPTGNAGGSSIHAP